MGYRSLTSSGVTLTVLLAASAASAQPWTAPGDVPLAEWVRGVQIQRRDQPLLRRPDAAAPRRGSAVPGTVLPIFGTARGPGCRKRWLLVGASAWVCDKEVRHSNQTPSFEHLERWSGTDGLPYRYYFVGPDGSLGYKELEAADVTAPDQELEPGFSVAVTRETNRQRETYVQSTDGLWIPRRDLVPIHATGFQGVKITDTVDVGWVWTEGAPVFTRPGGTKTRVLPRLDHVSILERRERVGAKVGKSTSDWLRVGDDAWVKASTVRSPTKATPPPELGPHERWIDVDITEQVLTAYEGERPVFATLVSTGRGTKGTAEATPEGLHRIWVKVITINMDNLENEEANRYYSMQAVPWVMFFKDGFGLHGTYWHSSFGRTRSAGCINLSPRDAAWLFHFASPHLPANWSAVHPTEYELGTLVRVR